MTAQRILLINEDGTATVGGVTCKLVPVEPRREMLNSAIDAHGHKLCEISRLGFRMSPQMMFDKSYAAMLSAAAIDLSGLPRVEREWKYDGKLARYHPQASHVTPDFRDGWNACLDAMGVKK